MYSREERMKAIELYIKYDKCAADVIHELGCPDRNTLPRWYEAYLKEQETGVLWERYSRSPRYSAEQKKTAVEHYLEHGRNLSRTVRALGYPSRETLRSWCDELAPGNRKQRVDKMLPDPLKNYLEGCKKANGVKCWQGLLVYVTKATSNRK